MMKVKGVYLISLMSAYPMAGLADFEQALYLGEL
jgi:hypothetical protein